MKDRTVNEYRIFIAAEFNQYLRDWFSDCRIVTAEKGTYLYCRLDDQASLFGMLQRIQNLGLPLIEVAGVDHHKEEIS